MTGSAQPGWYHAEGDPPGTERYWDGSAWTEGPRPVGGDISTPEVPDVSEAASSMPDISTPGGSMPDISTPGGSMPDISTPGGSMPDISTPGGSMPDISTPSASMPDISTPGGSMPDISTPSASMPDVNAPAMPSPGMPPVGGAVGSNLPQFGGGAPAVGMPVGGAFAEASKATTALVLSILGFFCCGLPAFAGVWMAREEKQAISEGRRDPSNEGTATAALVIGAIAVVITILLVLLVLIGAVFSG